MWSYIKNFFKRFLPIPGRTHNAQIQIITTELTNIMNKIKELNTTIETIEKSNILAIELISHNKIDLQQQEKILHSLLEEIKAIHNIQTNLCNKTDYYGEANFEAISKAREMLWAEIYNNTVSDSNWLFNKSFSPGRWAAGYPFLFVLYKTLNIRKPKRILELGFGATTKMITQYAAVDKNVIHKVVEHDLNWIDFFTEDFVLAENTEIVLLPWGYNDYGTATNIRVYDGFKDIFFDNVFDLVCIDGPLGGDMAEFSRIDVLKLIPDNLAESFVILFDDSNRIGEKNTIQETIKCLDMAKIEYIKKEYIGEKNTCIVCSVDNKFLSSL